LKFDFWNLEIFDVGNQQYFYYYFCVFAYQLAYIVWIVHLFHCFID
jgi:hypothetical protein